MALIISTNGHSAFRSEELEGVFHLANDKTGRLSNNVGLNFKSGTKIILTCKNSKEAEALKNMIINVMNNDKAYNQFPCKEGMPAK